MSRRKKIRVLLADDHPVVLAGVKNSLVTQKNIEVVGEATNGKEVLSQARSLLPDIVLMDINMPEMSGLEATKQLLKTMPDVKVLAFTMHDDKEYILEILRSGAQGYILKESSPAELVRAIETIHTGLAFFSPTVSRVLLEQYVSESQGSRKHPGGLSEREEEVLVLLADGCSNKEIAEKLFLSSRTVETHRKRIMEKLNLHSVAELTRFAVAKGLIPAK